MNMNKILFLGYFLSIALTYMPKNDSECEGISEVREELETGGMKLVCGQKPDGMIQPILDLTNSTSRLYNLTSEYVNDTLGIELSNTFDTIDPMYLDFTLDDDNIVQRTSDCVRVQRHDKWVQGCVQFIADIGATVLSDWISRLTDLILDNSKGNWGWTTTVYQHGLYFEIQAYNDTTQQHKTLESAIDAFFREHKWICYSYCLKLNHSNGLWSAYIKMYREGEDTAKTSFGCTSANHFSPGCDYLPNGDKAGQL